MRPGLAIGRGTVPRQNVLIEDRRALISTLIVSEGEAVEAEKDRIGVLSVERIRVGGHGHESLDRVTFID